MGVPEATILELRLLVRRAYPCALSAQDCSYSSRVPADSLCGRLAPFASSYQKMSRSAPFSQSRRNPRSGVQTAAPQTETTGKTITAVVLVLVVLVGLGALGLWLFNKGSKSGNKNAELDV